jgi:hypothetical protein
MRVHVFARGPSEAEHSLRTHVLPAAGPNAYAARRRCASHDLLAPAARGRLRSRLGGRPGRAPRARAPAPHAAAWASWAARRPAFLPAAALPVPCGPRGKALAAARAAALAPGARRQRVRRQRVRRQPRLSRPRGYRRRGASRLPGRSHGAARVQDGAGFGGVTFACNARSLLEQATGRAARGRPFPARTPAASYSPRPSRAKYHRR